MSKLIKILIFFNLLFLVLNKPRKQNIEEIEEKYKKRYIKEFKKSVKEYLTKHDLYKNDKKLVTKDIFKNIFKDIMMNGIESTFMSDIYDKVAEECAKDAFPRGVKKIKASEIEQYFEYDNIMDRINKYAKENNNFRSDL